MGGSSRPEDFDIKGFNSQQSIDYFVDYIEKWRVEMGSQFLRSGEHQEFTDFYMAAHSFGGYISGNYMLKHHQHIKKLIFLSPIGIKPAEALTEEERKQDPEERMKEQAK